MSEYESGCPSCVTNPRTFKVTAIRDANACNDADPSCSCRCHGIWLELMAERKHWVAVHGGAEQVAGG